MRSRLCTALHEGRVAMREGRVANPTCEVFVQVLRVVVGVRTIARAQCLLFAQVSAWAHNIYA